MKKILLVWFSLLAASAYGTHIVGGEFEFLHKGVDFNGMHRFKLALILYFDNINGDPAAADSSAIIKIFRKSDNAVMMEILLTKFLETNVAYKRPQCSNGTFISTDRFYYTVVVNGVAREVTLDPSDFDDPGGYYIAWERCCRNYTISNIYSQPPDDGIFAGQTFYLEFPALRINGQDFVNSSPSLFPPLSDYACKNRLYAVDFRGSDADGDSLVYSMVTPLNTHTGDALPELEPAPYPEVDYRPGFSVRKIMLGDPDLNISPSGMLTVVPKLSGLFVFAVKCEEFRNRIKIGEVRRDFQMLVLVNCPPSTPPVVEGKKSSDANFVRNALNVSFPNNATDEERCIDIRITDPDAAVQEETVEILAVAVSFEDDDLADDILPEIPTATISNGEPALFTVCFPQCPYTLGTYVLDIIVENGACGGSWLDTLRVSVNLEPPVNFAPVFTPQRVTRTAIEGGVTLSVPFEAEDRDGDVLELIPPPLSQIGLAVYGFTYTVTSNVPGKLTGILEWDTRCDVFDFSIRRDFKFYFQVNDVDQCELMPNDTLFFDMKRIIPYFHDPVIEYVPDPTLEKVVLTKKIYDNINFDVHAFDVDPNEILVLSAEGEGFSVPEVGAIFPTQTFTSEKTAPFSWHLNCDKINLNKKHDFHFYLIVQDNENICHYNLADTLNVIVHVLPPDNNTPVATLDNETGEMTRTLTMGEELTVDVVATDADVAPQDVLILEMLDSAAHANTEGFSFTTQGSPGFSPVMGTFNWKPTCKIFEDVTDGNYQREFEFSFRVHDNRCFNDTAADTVTLNITVSDLENTPGDFIPPNVITPGDDNGKNDYFAMEKLVDGKLINILPPDNCQGTFVDIIIFNRWGRKVYQSNDRNFRWFADSEAAGVYFYLLQFTNREYKGTVSVVTGDSDSGNR